jgi:transposase-like protein
MSFASVNISKRGPGEKSGNIINKKEYTSYIGSSSDFAKFIYQTAVNQGYGIYEKVIVLGDGATWIRTICNEKFPDAIQILDWYHLEENIYDFAKYIFKNKEDKYKPWAEMIKTYIMEEKADKALSEINKYSKVELPSGVVNLENYILNNIDNINYKDYKAKKYFIGSGAIESGNKTVLQRRLKQSGMRWSVDTAQPLLTLRAKVESGLWNEVKILIMNFLR